jgi:hypothetical protein
MNIMKALIIIREILSVIIGKDDKENNRFHAFLLFVALMFAIWVIYPTTEKHSPRTRHQRRPRVTRRLPDDRTLAHSGKSRRHDRQFTLVYARITSGFTTSDSETSRHYLAGSFPNAIAGVCTQGHLRRGQGG